MGRRRPHRRRKPESPEPGWRGEYPFVAIVGRPNVGKSTLFNCLLGQRLAITEPTAGTTRDRVAAIAHLDDGRAIELCDTGGIGGTGDPHDREVNRQIDLAMQYADLILFVLDVREGLLPLDQKIARRLKQLAKPVIVVANKVETRLLEATAGELYALGFPGDVACISALEGHGRSDLLERIARALPEPPPPAEEAEAAEAAPAEEGERVLRLAIVGRRNTGKSTYVNAVAGEQRVIVSDRPGTTRDAIDVEVEVKLPGRGARRLVLIDTAGLRKRGKADDHIEIISHGRAVEAVRRCDVALLFLDAVDTVGFVDKRLGSLIATEHKACVIVANKWDLADTHMSPQEYAKYVGLQLPGLDFAPLVTISARDGVRVSEPIDLAFQLHDQATIRVGTARLNRALGAALTLRNPQPMAGRVGKLYFGTQVAVNPVTLLLFVQAPELFDQAYRRYLVGQLRKHLPWREVPIKLCFRTRQSLRRRGGGLARRVERLGGLSDRARWVPDDPSQNVARLVAELDAADVQAALFQELGREEGDEAAPEEEESGEDAVEVV